MTTTATATAIARKHYDGPIVVDIVLASAARAEQRAHGGLFLFPSNFEDFKRIDKAAFEIERHNHRFTS